MITAPKNDCRTLNFLSAMEIHAEVLRSRSERQAGAIVSAISRQNPLGGRN